MSLVFISRLGRDRGGTAVIELALVAPLLALLVVGIVDMSNAFSHKLALEQGAQRAVEKIMQTTGDASVESTLTTEVQCQVNGSVNNVCNTPPASQEVTVTFTLDCTDTGGNITPQTRTIASASDATAFDALTCANDTDTESRYVAVNVQDDYAPMFPIHFAGIDDSVYHLSATAGMRTQ